MLITLIVPFHNEEQYLSRSIRSIQQQTFTDFEVLLIDDFSTDGSYALAEQIIQGDGHFRLICNKEKGLYNARNLALSMACGEYICFLDADDQLLPDYLSSLYADSQITDADLVVHGLIRIRADHQELVTVTTSGIFDLSVAPQFAFSSFDVSWLGTLVSKLFRRQLILQYSLSFSPHVLMCEDMYFVLSYLAVCQKLVLSRASHYHYISRIDSMSTLYWNYEIERQGLHDLQSAWQQLISCYDCPALRSSYGSFYGPYLQRLVFSCLTHPDCHSALKVNLAEIEARYLSDYVRFYRPSTRFTRALRWAIVRHYYKLYLLLMRIAFIRHGLKYKYI